ncbi:MAG: hypothetical protein EXX96DRAFT_616104 [Benjaminiella poitrasii]|nr:MAG: hypothetical protein EXX96DRAFT_616104 [Benjaminiella poitrasii]
MGSELVEDALKKNYIEVVNTLKTSDEGGIWKCPFCNPHSRVYKLNMPPNAQIERCERIKNLIKVHVELHKRDLLDQMFLKNGVRSYEKARMESVKRVRLWISGTIKDRKLYKQTPF